jgi:hypothetical protein
MEIKYTKEKCTKKKNTQGKVTFIYVGISTLITLSSLGIYGCLK